jgi:hypothetical protein
MSDSQHPDPHATGATSSPGSSPPQSFSFWMAVWPWIRRNWKWLIVVSILMLILLPVLFLILIPVILIATPFIVGKDKFLEFLQKRWGWFVVAVVLGVVSLVASPIALPWVWSTYSDAVVYSWTEPEAEPKPVSYLWNVDESAFPGEDAQRKLMRWHPHPPNEDGEVSQNYNIQGNIIAGAYVGGLDSNRVVPFGLAGIKGDTKPILVVFESVSVEIPSPPAPPPEEGAEAVATPEPVKVTRLLVFFYTPVEEEAKEQKKAEETEEKEEATDSKERVASKKLFHRSVQAAPMSLDVQLDVFVDGFSECTGTEVDPVDIGEIIRMHSGEEIFEVEIEGEKVILKEAS